MGGVQAQIANSTTPYNTVSPWFTYYTNDIPVSEIVKQQQSTVTTYIYSEKKPTSIYSIRYHFLYGENASYAGMAQYYQKYLIQKGDIQKRETSADLRLDVNILGAITKKQLKFFIPMKVQVAASKFNDVQRLTEEMTGDGVRNLNLVYQGAINGGMDYMVPNSLCLEKSLGSTEEFTQLNEYIQSIKSDLFLTVDFTKVYKKGNGLDVNSEISRFINKEPAVFSSYYPSSKDRDISRGAYLINPMSYASIIDSFNNSKQSVSAKTLFVSSLGSYLSGNYDDRHELTREDSKNLTAAALKNLSESGYSMMIDGGNQYALKYADSVIDIPVTSSELSMESYSVPFVSMVLHGYLDYSGPVLNQQGNYTEALLKNIENGAGLNYLLMTGDQLILTDTAYSDYYAVTASKWQDEIVATYADLNKTFAGLSNCTITDHKKLADKVFQTVYSNGTSIFVNYNDEAVTVNDTTIGAMSYQLVK